MSKGVRVINNTYHFNFEGINWNNGDWEIKKIGYKICLLSVRVLGSQNMRRSDYLLDSFLAKFARLHTCTRIHDCSFSDCALRLAMGRCFDELHSTIRPCWCTVAVTRLYRRLGQNSPPPPPLPPQKNSPMVQFETTLTEAQAQL